mmetsp:Transcript_37529/g.101713  ORF Transcript_37529/g.101713 Transcript_37529/m.101713 type:complete len:216 (+) Transcript_37529:2077-2724(+)
MLVRSSRTMLARACHRSTGRMRCTNPSGTIGTESTLASGSESPSKSRKPEAVTRTGDSTRPVVIARSMLSFPSEAPTRRWRRLAESRSSSMASSDGRSFSRFRSRSLSSMHTTLRSSKNSTSRSYRSAASSGVATTTSQHFRTSERSRSSVSSRPTIRAPRGPRKLKRLPRSSGLYSWRMLPPKSSYVCSPTCAQSSRDGQRTITSGFRFAAGGC